MLPILRGYERPIDAPHCPCQRFGPNTPLQPPDSSTQGVKQTVSFLFSKIWIAMNLVNRFATSIFTQTSESELHVLTKLTPSCRVEDPVPEPSLSSCPALQCSGLTGRIVDCVLAVAPEANNASVALESRYRFVHNLFVSDECFP